MNICIFCHDAYMSGANKSLYDWISSDKDDKFYIVLPHLNKNQDFNDLNNVEIINGNYFCLHRELTHKSIKYKIKKSIKKIYMFIMEKIIIYNLIKKIQKRDIDIIISNSFAVVYGAIIAKKINVPHFWHIREFMETDHQITPYDPVLMQDLTKYSNAIYISNVIEEYYKEKYKFKNSVVIYNQIHIDKNFDNEKVLFKDGNIRVIMSGTLQENKGQKEAIAAVEEILKSGIDVKFDIYGDGPQKDELTSIIKMSGYSDCISLRGYCDQLDKIRKNYDIALVCSSNEALGRVTVESMGSGCVTIGADAGCTPSIIKDGVNGYLYKLHDVEDLKNKIMYVYEHVENISTIRMNARKYVEDNFSKPIYKEIISYINSCV